MGKTHKAEVDLQTSHGVIRVPVRVVRRSSIRHLRVSVDLYNEVSLNIPPHVSERWALRFLQEQAEWIYELLRDSPGTLNLEDYLRQRPIVSGLGKDWQVELAEDRRTGFVTDRNDCRIRLRYDPGQDVSAQLAHCLRRFARVVIPARVEQLADRRRLRYHRIFIRDQRSRWGSCSERGTLSFNWRLVLLPVELHDYIIMHELAHLTHMNHSKAYWNLMKRYDPQCERNDACITELSGLLMRLGRTPTPDGEVLRGR